MLERLYGERLDRRIDDAILNESHVPIHEVLDALIGMAKALAVAHAAGISQRDVKPANTIIVRQRVVLFDFGLAIPEVLVDSASMLSGSVEYIAPELILGRVIRGGGALVDLYALGISAYELLTNATPFAGGAAEGTLNRHVTETPRDVRERRADVPLELAVLIRELLEKDPNERVSSAESVLWRLAATKKSRGSAKLNLST